MSNYVFYSFKSDIANTIIKHMHDPLFHCLLDLFVNVYFAVPVVGMEIVCDGPDCLWYYIIWS